MKCSDIGRATMDYEAKIQECRAESQKGDEENIHNKKNFNALKERINVAENYLGQLQNLERGLADKEGAYVKEIDMGEQYLKELESIKSYVQEVRINTGEKREVCECSIF